MLAFIQFVSTENHIMNILKSVILVFSVSLTEKAILAQDSLPEGSQNQIDCHDFDLMGILPIKEITGVIQNAVRNDDETQRLNSFVQSPHFTTLVQRVADAASGRKLLEFLGGIGLNVGSFMDTAVQQFQTTSATDTEVAAPVPAPGVSGLAKTVVGMLPLQRILKCMNLRVNTDSVFETLMEGLRSPEFTNLVANVRNSEQFSNLQSSLQERGVNVNAVIEQGLNFLRVPPGRR